MERKYAERLKRSFDKSLLDSPVPNKKIKILPGKKSKVINVLPDPLIPTKYVAQPPMPKPRTQKSRPVPLPRSIPKPIDEKVQKFIDEIAPYYRPEAIRKFAKELRDKKNLRVKVTEKDRALKNHVKSFEVAIIERRDPAKQLYYTTNDVARELEGLFQGGKGLKVYVTLYIIFKKKKMGFGEDDEGEVYFEFKNAYFNSKTFTITNSDQVIDALDGASEEINNRVAVWLSEGSG